MQPDVVLPLQRGCPRCGAPVPPANLELHLLRCEPAHQGVVGSVFGAAAGDLWPCAACTFLNAEEQRCCAMCGGVRDDADAQSPSPRAAVLGSVFRGMADHADEAALRTPGEEHEAALRQAEEPGRESEPERPNDRHEASQGGREAAAGSGGPHNADALLAALMSRSLFEEDEEEEGEEEERSIPCSHRPTAVNHRPATTAVQPLPCNHCPATISLQPLP